MPNEDFTPDSSPARGILVFLLAVLLVVGIVLTFRLVGTPYDVGIKEKDLAVAEVEKRAAEKRRQEEEKRLEKQRREELNLVLPWSMLLTRLNRIENNLDAITSADDEIKSLLEQLLTKPGASAIAESSEQIEAFRNIQLASQISKANSENARTEYGAIRVRFDKATSTNAKSQVLPSDELKAEVEKINSDVAKLLSDTRKSLVTLKNLASQTPSPVASVSLKDAIAKQEAKEEEAYLAEQAAALAKVRKEERAKSLQQAQEQERSRLQAIRELEAEKSKAEVESIGKEEDRLAQERLARDKEHAEAERIAREDAALQQDLAKVRTLLAPFIAKSNVQVNANKQRIVTEEALPVSWAIIQGARVLDTSEPVHWRQYIFAIESTGRDRGGAPVQPFDYTNIGPAQLLLKKHGPAMVRAKLLSP